MIYLLGINLDIDGGKPEENPRFEAALLSIRSVHNARNKVVILSHRGRPKGREQKLSLKPFAALLSKDLGEKVQFLDNKDLKKAKGEIESAEDGAIFLLENVRFLPGETKNSTQLAKRFAALGDRYINDDFPTSHHAGASNTKLAKLLPSKIGPVFKNELRYLDKVIKGPKHPFVLIVGGAKAKDKIETTQNLLKNADTVLFGGGPANTLLKARGVNIGKSLFDKDALEISEKIANKEKLVTPVDWEIKKDSILDIGSETIKEYKEYIKGAKTIVWNGPMGKFEEKPFDRGTTEIAKAVFANKKATTIIGGGDTLSAVKIPAVQLRRKNLLISTGGGAMLAYLAGKKLPALEAIK